MEAQSKMKILQEWSTDEYKYHERLLFILIVYNQTFRKDSILQQSG